MMTFAQRKPRDQSTPAHGAKLVVCQPHTSPSLIPSGTGTVTIGYDSADWRITLTLPNGVVVNYSGARPERSRRANIRA